MSFEKKEREVDTKDFLQMAGLGLTIERMIIPFVNIDNYHE